MANDNIQNHNSYGYMYGIKNEFNITVRKKQIKICKVLQIKNIKLNRKQKTTAFTKKYIFS